jgi:hypothetical protein
VQAVLAIPGLETFRKVGDAADVLMRDVGGVPLLVRVLATAARAGVDSVLVIWPQDVNPTILEACTKFSELKDLSSSVEKLVCVERFVWKDGWTNTFDPHSAVDWESISSGLEDVFLWLPWNWITHTRALTELSTLHGLPSKWLRPVMLEKRAVLCPSTFVIGFGRQPQGVSVTSPAAVQEAEHFLAGNAGEPESFKKAA